MFLLILLIGAVWGETGENCTCVPYYQCSFESGYLITDGKGLLDFRGFKNECTGYFDVCCNVSQTIPTTVQPLKLKGCGYAEPGSVPWSVALLQQDKTTKMLEYKCSASLIHERVILTVAHCIYTDDDGFWVARVGSYNVETIRIVKHPEFNLGTLQNDVALVILKSAVPLSARLGLICIPPPSIILKEDNCVVNVWRADPSHSSSSLKLINKPECQATLRNTRLGQFFQLHDSFICARDDDAIQTCGGDGGSALVCPVPAQPGRYHQVGIVSWGIGCGEKNVPVVHVNLALFRDWIDDVMTDNGLNINTYRY